MQPTRKLLPLKTSTSTEIHSISSVSSCACHFHFKSSDKYIATSPSSPAIRILWTNLNPGIWNNSEFTEAMCVSDKVMINSSFVNRVSNLSFLLWKPLIFRWTSLIPHSFDISVKFSWTCRPGYNSTSPQMRSNKNIKLFQGNFGTLISNKPKLFSSSKNNL